MSKRHTVAGFTVMVLSMIVIIGAVVYYEVYYGERTETFVPTEGVVVSTDVRLITNDDSPDEYEPVITYSYTVDGIAYENNEYAARDLEFDTREEAEEFLENYPIGKNITVYYNPSQPSEAVLVTGVAERSREGVALANWIGGVTLVFILVLFIPDIRSFVRIHSYLRGKNEKMNREETQLMIKNPWDPPKTEKFKRAKIVRRTMIRSFNDRFGGWLALIFLMIGHLGLGLLVSGIDFLGAIGAIIQIITFVVLTGYLMKDMGDEGPATKAATFICMGSFGYPLIITFSLLIYLLIPGIMLIWGVVAYGIYFIISSISALLSVTISLEIRIVIGLMSAILALVLFLGINQIASRYNSIAARTYVGRNLISEQLLFDSAVHGITLRGDRIFAALHSGKIAELSSTGVRYVQAHDNVISEIVTHNEQLITAALDGSIKIWDAYDLPYLMAEMQAPAAVCCIAVDAGKLYAGDIEGNVHVFDLRSHMIEQSHKLFSKRITFLEIQGDYILVNSLKANARLYDRANFYEYFKEFDDTDYAIISGLSREYSFVKYTNKVEIFQVENWEESIQKISFDDDIISYCFSTDLFIIGTERGKIVVYQRKNQVFEFLNTYHLHTADISSVLIHGSLIYSSSIDGSIKSFDIASNLDLVIQELVDEPPEKTTISAKQKMTSAYPCKICGTYDEEEKTQCDYCGNTFHEWHITQEYTHKCPICQNKL